ncbi:hypothetical protein IJF93_00660 [Candidatus Saccharibacteria bacterium]|nr:hypothetical protein [Candidatus Saccharibacteria bacterium]
MSDRKEEMLKAAEAEAEKARKAAEAEKAKAKEAEAKKKADAEAEKAEKAKKEAEAEAEAEKKAKTDPIKQLLEKVIDLQAKQAERLDGIEQRLEAHQPGAEPEVHFTMDDLELLADDDADEVCELMTDIMASKAIISEKLAEAKKIHRDFEKTFKSLFG